MRLKCIIYINLANDYFTYNSNIRNVISMGKLEFFKRCLGTLDFMTIFDFALPLRY